MVSTLQLNVLTARNNGEGGVGFMAVEQVACLVAKPVLTAVLQLRHQLVYLVQLMVHEAFKVGSGPEELAKVANLPTKPVSVVIHVLMRKAVILWLNFDA